MVSWLIGWKFDSQSSVYYFSQINMAVCDCANCQISGCGGGEKEGVCCDLFEFAQTGTGIPAVRHERVWRRAVVP